MGGGDICTESKGVHQIQSVFEKNIGIAFVPKPVTIYQVSRPVFYYMYLSYVHVQRQLSVGYVES